MEKSELRILFVSFLVASAVFAVFIWRAEAQHYTVYTGGVTYSNVRSCEHTDGNGAWEGPTYNQLGDPVYYEIGVAEINETRLVYRVEIEGSGCDYPANLTCNGVTKQVNYYHDSGPSGVEVLVFDITPSNTVSIYSTLHRNDPESNHGFRVNWVKVHYLADFSLPVDVKPESLNLKSNGRWISAHIKPSEGYSAGDINASTLLINGTIPAATFPIAVSDEDGDGVPDLMVKFSRSEVITYVSENINMTQLVTDKFMTVTLTITGSYNDGALFKGSDTVSIHYVPKNHK